MSRLDRFIFGNQFYWLLGVWIITVIGAGWWKYHTGGLNELLGFVVTIFVAFVIGFICVHIIYRINR